MYEYKILNNTPLIVEQELNEKYSDWEFISHQPCNTNVRFMEVIVRRKKTAQELN